MQVFRFYFPIFQLGAIVMVNSSAKTVYVNNNNSFSQTEGG